MLWDSPKPGFFKGEPFFPPFFFPQVTHAGESGLPSGAIQHAGAERSENGRFFLSPKRMTLGYIPPCYPKEFPKRRSKRPKVRKNPCFFFFWGGGGGVFFFSMGIFGKSRMISLGGDNSHIFWIFFNPNYLGKESNLTNNNIFPMGSIKPPIRKES